MLMSSRDNERGAVLVVVAVALPVFFLLTALIIDAGNWFTHERQLRNRADAAVQAAGLEFSRQWARCTEGTLLQKAAAGTAIVTAAKSYAGVNFNAEITEVLPTDIVINGGNEAICVPTHATSTEVKVTEQEVDSLFGSLGLPLGNTSETARIELLQAASETDFVPLAVEDQRIVKAQARFFNGCTGNSLGAPVDLTPLSTQTVPGMTLWGSLVQITLPNAGPASFASQCPAFFDYEPVTVEVRLASRDEVNLNMTCAALVAAPFADCFQNVTQMRTFACQTNVLPVCAGVDDDGAGETGDRPLVFDVTLGGESCSPDPYYARLTPGASQCSFGASVLMDWSDRPGEASGFQADLVVDGRSYPLSGPGNELGTWVASGVDLDDLGPAQVRIDWSWYSEQPGPGWPCNPANPCEQDGSIIVHRTNLADDPVDDASPTDIVRLARFSTTPTVDPLSALHSVHASGGGVNIYFTVGLRSERAPGQLAGLRTQFAGPALSRRGLVCDPDYAGGQTETMIVEGCKPPYSANAFASGFWWDGMACPSPATWFSTPYGNTPWRCLRTEAQSDSSAQQLADGIAARTGNGSGQCDVPNAYAQYFVDKTAEIAMNDRRLMPVFVVPFGSFKGPADNAVPILEIAYFYVTDWGAPHNNGDPCADRSQTREPPVGRVDGYLVSVIVPNTGPTEPAPLVCDQPRLRPCRAVLSPTDLP
jgi:hypothetical protein